MPLSLRNPYHHVGVKKGEIKNFETNLFGIQLLSPKNRVNIILQVAYRIKKYCLRQQRVLLQMHTFKINKIVFEIL